jgi:hypothetical protein
MNSTRVEFIEPLQFLPACALRGGCRSLVVPFLGHIRIKLTIK